MLINLLISFICVKYQTCYGQYNTNGELTCKSRNDDVKCQILPKLMMCIDDEYIQQNEITSELVDKIVVNIQPAQNNKNNEVVEYIIILTPIVFLAVMVIGFMITYYKIKRNEIPKVINLDDIPDAYYLESMHI